MSTAVYCISVRTMFRHIRTCRRHNKDWQLSLDCNFLLLRTHADSSDQACAYRSRLPYLL
ncbi:hypothetical protein [Thalassolituus hydrocarboniclasticus]|uniref:Uncharacterized protein n=1 Tax=Thalassolituus hydrocarboniclasticus TaxID=2742796 RepID=A0ABY6A8Z6_9GAMM|nr:hypothetical protein [Thalassolituus hydrocarboniclasticus]UXD87080.1 hypothetical protein HUF19_06325 [Thalassolituus hydrocarboniclasticus]